MNTPAPILPPSRPGISFSTTCKGRLHHLRESLPRTLDNLLPGDEVVLLDYDSQDGLAEWVRAELTPEIRAGRVRFVQLDEGPQPWHPTRAKNIAHRCARHPIVCNLDADNWVVPGFAAWLREVFERDDRRITSMSPRMWGGSFGRIALRKSDWLALGGYDERLRSWGWDDNDILLRAEAAGVEVVLTPDTFAAVRRHGDCERVFAEGAKDKASSLAINRRITEATLAGGNCIANAGQPCANVRVRVNFA